MSESSVGPVNIGVGIDTARYGHHVAFLGEDREEVSKDFSFVESSKGYGYLEDALRQLVKRNGGPVHFHVRIDAAGQYAVNLEAFLRRLDLSMTISVGDPKRNKDYKNAHFPKRKADAVDSRACARFGVIERPKASVEVPAEMRRLREVASALNSQRKHTTRRVNQLHNHLARVFPELATMASNVSAQWVLEVLAKYPSAERIGASRIGSLAALPHVGADRAKQLREVARSSTASLKGSVVEDLVRHAVQEVQHSKQAERALEAVLENAYDELGDGGHRQLLTIPGIGKRTAAALVAKIVSIDRFATPEKLVSYFGVFPEEDTSGVDKHGNPRPSSTGRMSAKGSDLVRGLLWMACQSAIQYNPAIRALYARQRAMGKRGDVALGHCMRKMLHLVFAIWNTQQQFDPQHYPWEAQRDTDNDGSVQLSDEKAAGRTGLSPDSKAVTAATNELATRKLSRANGSVKSTTPATADLGQCQTGPPVNFAHVRNQITMETVLLQLGVLEHLRGHGLQRRGPCPVHGSSGKGGRPFSAHLGKHVFRCLNASCAAQGNVLDLWAAVHGLGLREAAIDLSATFNLSTTPNSKYRSY